MKKLIVLLLCSLSLSAYSQDKTDYIYFNSLTEVTGTDYVIASVDNMGKMFTVKNHFLLFINTRTGESKPADFPADGSVRKVEQVRIDSLGINKILVSAQTADVNGKKGIDWEDPTQLFLISPDGQQKTQLTETSFFTSRWLVNRTSGNIVVTGYYDSNKNGKYDKTDKDAILVYSLATMKLVKEI